MLGDNPITKQTVISTKNVSKFNLGAGESVTLKKGYIDHDITISNSSRSGVKTVIQRIYGGKTGTKKDIAKTSCSTFSHPTAAPGYHSSSMDKTENIPLFDLDGQDAMLNTVLVTTSGSGWTNAPNDSVGQSVNFTLVTDTGIKIASGGSTNTTYNMFDYELGDSKYLILHIWGTVSAQHGSGPYNQCGSSAQGSAEAKYIILADE